MQIESIAFHVKENSLIAEEILLEVAQNVQPGVSTLELNEVAARGLRRHNALPAALFLGASSALSISINDEVLFGEISDTKRVQSGDIVKLDFGIYRDGVFSDLGLTVPVGDMGSEMSALVASASGALIAAVSTVSHGVTVQMVSGTIEASLRFSGVTPLREMCGHGIGRGPHEQPFIPAVTGLPFIDYNHRLQQGTVICIEPFVTSGAGTTKAENRFHISTLDGAPVTFCEVPVLVTDDGGEVLAPNVYAFLVAQVDHKLVLH